LLLLVLSVAALAGLAATDRAETANAAPRPPEVKLVAPVTEVAGPRGVPANVDLDEVADQILDQLKFLVARLKEAVDGVVDRIREAADRTRASNDLKQIGLATHNYADVNNGQIFPYAIMDKQGKPLLSWRVALLPYVEQDNLYKQFKLDEPWDSEHNKKLLAIMPKIYAPARGKKTREPYSTYYRVFTGKDALFAPNGKNRFTIGNVPDGTSNTIAVVEAGEAVPWTKPEGLEYDAKKPLPKLGGQFRNGFLVLMLDGSVRVVSRKVSETTLRNAIMPADGNPLGSDW